MIEPGQPDARSVSVVRLILCASALAMILASWPLWADDGEFPRVPFLARIPALPAELHRLLRMGAAAGLAMAATGLLWRTGLAAALGLLAWLVLEDQHRFQPWVYQLMVVGACLSLATPRSALAIARWSVVGLYAHSALSKLDVSFCREMGETLLATLAGFAGLDPRGWPAPVRTATILAMPGIELLAAVALCFGRTRRRGVACAVGLHLGLIATLGPLGLNHSVNVLIWNASMACLVVALFWRGPTQLGGFDEPDRGLVAWAILGLTLALPFGERLGWYDSWPSHALYASHTERTEVEVHESDLHRLPARVAGHLGPATLDEFRRLDLAAWSRSERRTPLYPQNRAWHGVAVAISDAHGVLVRVKHWGRASALSGERSSVTLVGRDALEAYGRGGWLNRMPAAGQTRRLRTSTPHQH